jgi:hypothetical protein
MTGMDLECRVARLLNREGAFVRKRVDVSRWLAEKIQITDIDVLRYEFGADLSVHRTVVECKSGDAKSAPKEVDRLFWLHGVRNLVGAEGALLVVDKQPTARIRWVADSLNVGVQGIDDIARREGIIGIATNADWGAHDPEYVRSEERIFKAVKDDQELQRAIQFLRSTFWHLDPTVALKRTVALIEILSKRLIDGLQHDEAESLRWLIADGSVCFILAATQLASMAIKLPLADFRITMTERMSEGLASTAQLKQLSKAVDHYMLGIFERAGVPSHISVGALGAFYPTPPPYIEPLLEVLERFGERPFAARNAALALDVLIGHRVKGGRSDWPDLGPFQVLDPDATLGLVRTALAFLSGNFGLPTFVSDAVPSRNKTSSFASTNEKEFASSNLKVDVQTPDQF